jgi:cytochrome P450
MLIVSIRSASPEAQSQVPTHAVHAVRFGARTCIGASFAIMEGIAILATLVRCADFEWDGEHAPEP